MIRAVILSICTLLTAGLAEAQPKWIHIKADHFDMYSSAGERDSRDTLNYLEQVRAFFISFLGAPPAEDVPVYVVMFGSAKEYEPYKPNDFAAAFFLGTADRDYVVLGKTGEDTAQVVVHEYAHLIEKHAHMNLPPWLNEGLAELFSTFRVVGSNIQVAAPLIGHLRELQSERWVPLATILSAEADSPYYNESKKATALYSEGWALTHMLATTPKYSPGFEKVTSAITKGTLSTDAIEQTYGMPFAKIEEELRLYIAAGNFNTLVMKSKLDVSKEKWTAEPANLFDVHLTEANLFDRAKTIAEAKKRLEVLLQEDAKRPEPWASLAYISWHEGDNKGALDRFNKAYTLGDHSTKLLWDYGRLAEANRPDEADKALSDLVALQPENVDAIIELAAVRYNRRQYPRALEALTAIKTASPAQAPRLFSLMANAQVQTGQYEEARASATRWMSFAKTDQDRAKVGQLLQFLDQRAQSAARAAVVGPPPPVPSGALELDEQQQAIEDAIRAATKDSPRDANRQPTLKAKQESDADAPTLIRMSVPEPVRSAPVVQVLSMSGTLIETGCSGTPTLVLQTDAGRKTFLVLSPSNTVVTGTSPTLDCGKMAKAVPLQIDYDLPPPGTKVDGVVKALHFPE
ncbi:MAG: hypothetical protein ABI824_18740 [Acidobacteriota bacterium]